MCVSHEDRSPFAIHGCDTAPTPTGFAEHVSDDFPLLHAPYVLRIIVCRRRTFRLLWRSVCSNCNFCMHCTLMLVLCGWGHLVRAVIAPAECNSAGEQADKSVFRIF